MNNIYVPISLRSIWKKRCPKQEQAGFYVTKTKIITFTKKLGRKGNDVDAVIPMDEPTQLKPDHCKIRHGEIIDKSFYFEMPNGKSGWCCSECGSVFQWG